MQYQIDSLLLQYGLSYIGIAWIIGIVFFVVYFFLIFLYFLPKYFKLKQAIITQNEPPEGLRPSEVASLYKFFGISTRRMLTADILYLASLGYIKIQNTELDTNEKSQKLFENIVAGILLFRGWFLFLLLAVFVSNFVPRIGLIVIIALVIFDRIRIKNYIHLLLHPTEFSITRTGKDISNMPIKLVPLYDLISKEGEILTLDKIKGSQKFSEFEAYVNEISENTKGHKKTKQSLFNPFFFIQIFIIFGIGYFFNFRAGPFQHMDINILLVIIVFTCGMFIYQIIKNIFKRQLFKMTSVGYKMAGFYRYVLVAEKDRALFDDDPTQKFSKYLPYAVAFGFEDRWIKSFKNTINLTLNWYQGANFDSMAASIMELDLIMNSPNNSSD